MLEMQASKSSTTNPIKTKTAKLTEESQKLKPKINHPSVAAMVNKAVESLNNKKGCSVMAIKKYLAANYMVDTDKLGIFIKKYLAKAVENKLFIQTTGKGCIGSFKLAGEPSKAKKPVKSHVTASRANKQNAQKITKKIAKSPGTIKKPTSKQQSRDSADKSVGRKRIITSGKAENR